MTVTVAEFCLALHRVSLRGNRDEQGVHGEDLWTSLEAVERKRGIESVELPTTLEETFALADRLGMDVAELRYRLTRMPDWSRVLVNDWEEYRREWWWGP